MTGQQGFIDPPPPATNNQRQAPELRVAQQLDRGKKSVHVKVGNAPGQGAGAFAVRVGVGFRCGFGFKFGHHIWNCAACCVAAPPCPHTRISKSA